MNRSLKKFRLSRRVVIAPLTLCLLVATNPSSPVGAQELLPPSVISQEAGFGDWADGAALPDEELGEAMLRGPVHEAFAEQVSPNPEPGLIVNQTPPEPIEELPPEVRPEGERVEWIPGYWAWDDDRQDFIWISGLWRNMPPKLRWLPGYWAEVEQGFQWVAGTWIQEQEPELEYIAQSPPETLELGPVGDAPSANHFWVPGHWSWQDTRYAWSPGYWSVSQVNWVWVPTRYLYTPRGYVYCHGYWDYPLTSRGSLFAPYWFSHRSALRPGYYFRPRVLISLNILPWHFWVRPGYSHYYFGDYYATSYRQRGIHPWHSYYRQSHGIDPLFRYYDRNHRGNVSFYQQINQQFNLSVNQSDHRPPRSYRDQRERGLMFQSDRGPAFSQPTFRGDQRDRDDRSFLALGRPIEALTENASSDFRKVSQTELSRMQERMVALRAMERSRRQAESEKASARPVEQSVAPAQPGSGSETNDTVSAETPATAPGESGNDRNRDRSSRDALAGDQLRGRDLDRDAREGDRTAGQLQRPDRWRLPTIHAGQGPDRATDAGSVADRGKRDSSRPSQLDSSGTVADGQGRTRERGQRSGTPNLGVGPDTRSPYKASRPATDNAAKEIEALPGARDRIQPADPRATRPAGPDNTSRLNPSDRDRPNVSRPPTNGRELNRSERGRDSRDALDRRTGPPAASLPSAGESERRSDRGRPAVAPDLARPASPPTMGQPPATRQLPTIRPSAQRPIKQQPAARPSSVRPQPQAMPRPTARQSEVRQPPAVRQPPVVRQPAERQSPRAIERPRGGGGEAKGNRGGEGKGNRGNRGGEGKGNRGGGKK